MWDPARTQFDLDPPELLAAASKQSQSTFARTYDVPLLLVRLEDRNDSLGQALAARTKEAGTAVPPRIGFATE